MKRKMFKQISIICLMATFFIPKIQSACRIQTPSCYCVNKDSKSDEYGCNIYEKNSIAKRITVTVNLDDNEIRLDCPAETKFDDCQVIPNIPMTHLKKLTINYCPINENITFRDFLQKFNVSTVEIIEYQISPKMDENIINGDYFESIAENLSRIIIKGNSKTIIESDLLKYTKNLTVLTLSKIHNKLTSNFFVNTPQIRFIEFNQYNDEHLPENLFENLNDLQELLLWNMNISILNESMFHSLDQLKVLDLHGNLLEKLPETIFERSRNLHTINISFNRFVSLSGPIFQNTKNLSHVNLSNNKQYLNLTNGLFSNLQNLKTVSMENSKIVEVSEDLFWNSSNILRILMRFNQIQYLPSRLFRDTKNLSSLDLSHNQLTKISKDLFKNLRNLEKLDLSYNQISSISSENFLNLNNLYELNLEGNSLTHLNNDVFVYTAKLTTLSLKRNQLSFGEFNDAIKNRITLVDLDLSHNNITFIPNEWRFSLRSMKKLNLAYNQIQRIEFDSVHFGRRHSITIDLTNNLIKTIDFTSAEFTVRSSTIHNSNDQILISNNPINCDCRIHHLVKYFKGEMDKRVRGVINLLATNLTCSEPLELQDRQVTGLKLQELYCAVDDKYCPEKCGCKVRIYDASTIVDCSNRNLTILPTNLPHFKGYSNITLYVNNNNLSTFNINETFAISSGYQNITELHLHNNRLSQITWLPKWLKVVKLHSNRFERIDVPLLQNLSKLEDLTLHNNPWMCGCENVGLMNFIQKKYVIIENKSNILCDRNAFFNITSNDLCKTSNMAIAGIVTFFIIFTLTTSTLLIAFYNNIEAIKVWLYKHKWCLWWVSEQDLDKDKLYDAFVCHAHQDVDFVTQQLIPNLEECENPFKLCIHSRDWLAGVMIPDQIARAVSESKRTLVLLSPHFLESAWAQMEFRAAHKNALDEGRTRVIIIKLGDIGSEDNLSPEMKSYLKFHTYIEWGDKRFWDKLRYALPHPPPLSSRAALISQRIKQVLGDTKLELQTVTATQPPSILANTQTPNKPQITSTEPDDDKIQELLHTLQKHIAQGNNNANRNIA